MNVIRGAITIDSDTMEEVKNKTEKLLFSIKDANNLTEENTKAIIFSMTQDIHSFYPAKAARSCGFENVPLFSAAEPLVDGALPLCIRVMIFAEGLTAKEKHIYLGKAANLRKDLSKKLVIALDGPAGSGKSTIAKLIAKSYNILYLDTGAMYRACALKLLKEGVNASENAKVEQIIQNVDLEVKYENGTQHTYLDGEDVSEKIRVNEVSMLASTVATLKVVREKMVEKQRELAANISCIMDGRDIGTAVLPNAEHKFFLTADVTVRAERRLKELKEKGNTTITLDELKKEIEERDYQDSHREFSPLKKADDAEVVDTSNMNIDEVVAFIRSKIQEKI